MTLNPGNYESLRRWYLARLRKLAAEAEQEAAKTPATFIAMDRDLIKQMAQQASGTPGKQASHRTGLKGFSLNLSAGSCLLIWLGLQLLAFFLLCKDSSDLSSAASSYFGATINVLFASDFTFARNSQCIAYLLFYVSTVFLVALLPLSDPSGETAGKSVHGAKLSGSRKQSDPGRSQHASKAIELCQSLGAGMVILLISAFIVFKILSTGEQALAASLALLFPAASLLLWQLKKERNALRLSKASLQKLGNLLSAQTSEQLSPAANSATEEPSGSQLAQASMAAQFADLEEAISELILKERAIADYSETVLISLSPELIIEACSPNMTKYWGYSPFELLGQSLSNLVFSEDRLLLENSAAECRRSANLSFDCRLKTKENLLIDCRWHMDWSEKFQRIFATVDDVSDEKKLERTRQDFIAKLTHDMRSPLSAAKLSLSSFSQSAYGQPSPEAAQVISRTQSGLTRVLSLIDEMLEAEKLSSGEAELNADDYRLRSIVMQAVDELKAASESRGVQILLEEAEAVRVHADPNLLLRAVSNLLSNAISFSPEQSIISISIEKQGKEAVLKIKDEGPGVPEEQQKLIFERFRRARNLDNPERKSSGLGLSICQDIIKAHGGLIGVESIPPAGSTFWFRLPLSKDEE